MCAAIEVPEGCTLTISGEGSLKATGGEGAGIGASSRRNGSLGTIVIDGGDIKAYGGEMAAGIGGSAEGGSGTIIINNGTVYAKGGHGSYYMDIQNVYGGAGIGGGANGCVDKIEINGGNVTAYGGYATNAGRHPGAAIGAGGGGAKAVEGGYKYGEIAIKGGTVSAIAYKNEVYAIGIAVKPGQSLPGGTLDGSISISNEATVNLNGGDYFPKSENFELKKYTIQGTIADVRFIESTYPVTISVGEITWNAGTMKVSDYQGTLTASNYAFAAADPYRAATSNKGIMNGIDPVVVATGNDWRGMEAGVHSYCSRNGRYTSLTRWEKDANGDLTGSIELPTPVGLVGGATKIHPGAQACVKILGVTTAAELAQVIAAVGLAQNFAAMRALATDGIQKGHMKLHARNLATVAGATAEQLDAVVAKMVADKKVSVDYAKEILASLK